MPLDPSAVGVASEPARISWSSKDALLYAVGIGAGPDDLAFSTENSIGFDQAVYPTFAVVAGSGQVGRAMDHIGTYDPAAMVHGGQQVRLHRPLTPDGHAVVRSQVVAMHDKGTAAVVVMETEAASDAGVPLYAVRSSVFIRGEGGWGGERGPSGPRNVAPGRPPDHEVAYPTTPEQPYVYRLSGDRHPLHSDPSFARRAGFERPILHGLCTYGITGRALLRALCDNDPARFLEMDGRFSAPVYPGQTLVVRMWVTAPGEAVFTTAAEGGPVVLDQGLVRFAT